MKWDENKHPRDKDGKFTDGTSLAIELKPDPKIEALKSMSIDELGKIVKRDLSKKRVFSDGADTNSYFNTQAHKRWEQSLTESQKDAIHAYTNEGYKDINYLLRYSDDCGLRTPKATVMSRISDIDKALETYVLHENIQVYRAVDSGLFFGNVNLLNSTTANYRNNAFMSATPTLDSDALTQDTLLIITIPKGIGNGAYINNLSEYKNQEYEFLIPRNKSFKINKAYKDGNTYKVEMEMLND